MVHKSERNRVTARSLSVGGALLLLLALGYQGCGGLHGAASPCTQWEMLVMEIDKLEKKPAEGIPGAAAFNTPIEGLRVVPPGWEPFGMTTYFVMLRRCAK